MLRREHLIVMTVMMVFAAVMMVLKTTPPPPSPPPPPPALPPPEALWEAELNRWVVKRVQAGVRPRLGSNVSIEGYQSSEMERTWLSGKIAKGTLCDHARKPAITAKA